MSDETKRDVFDEVRYKFRNFKNEHRHGMYASPDSIDHYLSDALKRYAAALPDDLPVIPEAQSDWIKQCKANDESLSFALGDETTPIEVTKTFRVWSGYTDKNKDKWLKLQNTFSRAWVLGIWRVEETGEIVKLEEEK